MGRKLRLEEERVTYSGSQVKAGVKVLLVQIWVLSLNTLSLLHSAPPPGTPSPPTQ